MAKSLVTVNQMFNALKDVVNNGYGDYEVRFDSQPEGSIFALPIDDNNRRIESEVYHDSKCVYFQIGESHKEDN